jgi:hypothetical protein
MERKAKYPGEVRPAAPRGTANIPKPEKDPVTGQYIGAIGQQYALSADERASVRKILASAQEPLLLSEIADRVDPKLKLISPRFTNLALYVRGLMPVEVEEIEARRPLIAGQERPVQLVKGYRGTDKLRELREKGLA